MTADNTPDDGAGTDSQQARDLRFQDGPHVFVGDLHTAALSEHDRHHLERSLRLRDGDPLTASDGQGRWRAFRFGPSLVQAGPLVEVAPAPWPISLGIALTKGSKPELAVQKATELGIDRIVLFSAEHSVVRWDAAKAERTLERLGRVAREAAMQSRQVAIPTVDYVDDFAEVIRQGFARADFGGRAIDSSVRALAIGPEGGWSHAERAQLVDSVDLGGSVLRAETAAIAACTRMAAFRYDA